MTEIFSRMKLGAWLVMAALVVCMGCKEQKPVDPRISDTFRPLIMLTYPTVPPCSYVDASGKIVGTDIDFARRIADRMGRKLVIEGVEFKEILPRLKAGTADFGIATIIITDARLRDVDFSEPYDVGGACFLYRIGGRKPRMSQIAMSRIGVEADSVHDLYICLHGCDPVRFVHLNDAIASLERREIDAVFFDAIQLNEKAIESNGKFVVTPLETKDCYGVAVDKRRPDVLEAANAIIAEGGAK